ncbi:MAG: orotidine-5'-phosphate decarboxylase [Balneolaceae bacterium]
MTYTEKLLHSVRASRSTLCVGLDPDPEKIPSPLKSQFPDPCDLVFEFCRRVIESTKMDAAAYKPNIAFFEALGPEGWQVLHSLTDLIPGGKVIVADAKRGDIGTTAEKYRTAFFDHLAADAITLNPLMGLETLDPFLVNEAKAVYALAMTSNTGAADFLQLSFHGRNSLGEYISEQLAKKQADCPAQIGMVVGATTTAEKLLPVLDAFPSAPLLIPGIGAQGGDPDVLKTTLSRHTGIPLVNSSRAILYAGGDRENWEELVAVKASETRVLLEPITQKFLPKE